MFTRDLIMQNSYDNHFHKFTRDLITKYINPLRPCLALEYLWKLVGIIFTKPQVLTYFYNNIEVLNEFNSRLFH
jgi:hypothetical protein